ncbi:hypothetical protein F5Y17DRAFT_418304 [Xylariaceae sp. FL0594]|nr:hypothetical protein F5Y17DRAFT_418304 [Xylariaceae sp. FL0594]
MLLLQLSILSQFYSISKLALFPTSREVTRSFSCEVEAKSIMAGLVAYDSSDDEDEVNPQPEPKSLPKTDEATADRDRNPNTTAKEPESLPEILPKPNIDDASNIYGPQVGLSVGADGPVQLPDDPLGGVDAGAIAALMPIPAPGSPYSASREILRNLTLPTVPDMDIPPSPPGSPSEVTGRKFESFLDLKKKGVHFNSRLADTPAMRNPALVDKLLAFTELGHRDQFRTTLPLDLWDPDAFPRHAYKEQLRQSQSDIARANARAPGTPVSFVGAGTPVQQSAQASKTEQELSRAKRKTRFDM